MTLGGAIPFYVGEDATLRQRGHYCSKLTTFDRRASAPESPQYSIYGVSFAKGEEDCWLLVVREDSIARLPSCNKLKATEKMGLLEENARLQKGLEFLLGRHFSPGGCGSVHCLFPLDEQ